MANNWSSAPPTLSTDHSDLLDWVRYMVKNIWLSLGINLEEQGGNPQISPHFFVNQNYNVNVVRNGNTSSDSVQLGNMFTTSQEANRHERVSFKSLTLIEELQNRVKGNLEEKSLNDRVHRFPTSHHSRLVTSEVYRNAGQIQQAKPHPFDDVMQLQQLKPYPLDATMQLQQAKVAMQLQQQAKSHPFNPAMQIQQANARMQLQQVNARMQLQHANAVKQLQHAHAVKQLQQAKHDPFDAVITSEVCMHQKKQKTSEACRNARQLHQEKLNPFDALVTSEVQRNARQLQEAKPNPSPSASTSSSSSSSQTTSFNINIKTDKCEISPTLFPDQNNVVVTEGKTFNNESITLGNMLRNMVLTSSDREKDEDNRLQLSQIDS
ncbi:hypothetical protein NE237_029618 [Protea cynaroides]|uniref:Uncharacterized protein n=1 Tax=Protea cynaroides TaxID=273540 RepID=A0A9Q0JUZ4_9MAGN|nr:hypothetical protein NE237_029618 [Protea cynaroides]